MRIEDLRYREVINISTGRRLGYVGDVDMDISNGRILALIVPGPYKFLGLFGRGDDFILPWDHIIRIGDDIILVSDDKEERCPPKNKRQERRAC